MGFMSRAEYTVRPARGGVERDGEEAIEEGLERSVGIEEGGWVLIEVGETSCSAIFRPFVEWTMVPVRRKMHAQILERAAEMRSGTADGEM